MQLLNKTRALRTLGGVVAALAIVPWIGAGAAQAAGGGDDSCATRPSGVSGDATCSLLLGPNGTKVFGETWAVRTSDNHLVVWTFPDLSLDGSDSVQLCVRSSAAYPAKHQCNASDADNAWGGGDTTVDLPLTPAGVSADEQVYWALGVAQGSSIAVSLGSQGPVPGQSPSPTPSTEPLRDDHPQPVAEPHALALAAARRRAHTHSHPSTGARRPVVARRPRPDDASPSPSVSPSTTHTDGTSPSPSTSVLGTKLAHTGAGDVTGRAGALPGAAGPRRHPRGGVRGRPRPPARRRH